MSALLKYDAACRAVAEARTFDEVREWEDKAAAVREYTRRIGNRQLELDAIEIRERARRRRGELLLALKTSEQIADSRKKPLDGGRPVFTLEQLGITKDESSRDQKIARLDGDSFERLVARCRAYAETHPEKHTFDMLNAEQKAAKRAREAEGYAARVADGAQSTICTHSFATAINSHASTQIRLGNSGSTAAKEKIVPRNATTIRAALTPSKPCQSENSPPIIARF